MLCLTGSSTVLHQANPIEFYRYQFQIACECVTYTLQTNLLRTLESRAIFAASTAAASANTENRALQSIAFAGILRSSKALITHTFRGGEEGEFYESDLYWEMDVVRLDLCLESIQQDDANVQTKRRLIDLFPYRLASCVNVGDASVTNTMFIE